MVKSVGFDNQFQVQLRLILKQKYTSEFCV